MSIALGCPNAGISDLPVLVDIMCGLLEPLCLDGVNMC